MKVLLIDNDSVNNMVIQRSVKKFMKDKSPKFHISLDGKEAMSLLEKETEKENLPQIIFLDTSIKYAQDFLTFFESKKQDLNNYTKLYVLSWSINPEEHEKVKKYDFVNGFYTKPLFDNNIKEILEQVS